MNFSVRMSEKGVASFKLTKGEFILKEIQY